MRAHRVFFIFLIMVTFFPYSSLQTQPAAVVILSPRDSSAGLQNPIRFTWTQSPLALAYTVQVSTDTLFHSTIMSRSTADTTCSTSRLGSSTRYYWRVRAEDTIGASVWAYGLFTTKLDTPSLSDPESYPFGTNLTPTLHWSNVCSFASYTVQLSVLSDFSVLIKSVNTSFDSLTVDSLSRATTYYWRVKAFITGDTTGYSGSHSFTTIPNLPAVPQLLFPADNSTDNAVNVRLRWNRVATAQSYDLQISASPIFSTILRDTTIVDTFYRPQPFFRPNKQYFWRVSATDNGGTGNFSETYRMITGADTNKPQIAFQNIDIGSVKTGLSIDTSIVIKNTGKEDLIISSIKNKLWTFVSSGLPLNPKNAAYGTYSIYFLTSIGTNLYTGGMGYGIYLSTDNGNSWNAINSGLPISNSFPPTT
ncbi:MAG TPA: hypothetical protein VMU30_07120, partial [Bacteroidota bacterium]|nr:hypothetical protein [Bacteroidota bacterium]